MPQTFFACHTSCSASRLAFEAGATTTFLKLYSRQLGQACARAIRSARSREMLLAKSVRSTVEVTIGERLERRTRLTCLARWQVCPANRSPLASRGAQQLAHST